MTSNRWRLPDDPLRAGAVTTAVVGLVAVACLALAFCTALGLSAWYPVKAAAPFAIVMLLAIRYLSVHHAVDRFGLANQITTIRAMFVALIAGLIGEQESPHIAWVAAATTLLTAALDGVDGWLARRTQAASTFGARFDTEVDALLVQVLAILVWRYGKAGPWIVMSGLLHYVFVTAGWLWPWMRRPLSPSLRGRAICVVQIVALILATVPIIEPPASTCIAAVGLLALCYSFLVDTWRLWRTAD